MFNFVLVTVAAFPPPNTSPLIVPPVIFTSEPSSEIVGAYSPPPYTFPFTVTPSSMFITVFPFITDAVSIEFVFEVILLSNLYVLSHANALLKLDIPVASGWASKPFPPP